MEMPPFDKLQKIYDSGLTFSITVHAGKMVSAQLNLSMGYPKTYDSLTEAIDALYEESKK